MAKFNWARAAEGGLEALADVSLMQVKEQMLQAREERLAKMRSDEWQKRYDIQREDKLSDLESQREYELDTYETRRAAELEEEEAIYRRRQEEQARQDRLTREREAGQLGTSFFDEDGPISRSVAEQRRAEGLPVFTEDPNKVARTRETQRENKLITSYNDEIEDLEEKLSKGELYGNEGRGPEEEFERRVRSIQERYRGLGLDVGGRTPPPAAVQAAADAIREDPSRREQLAKDFFVKYGRDLEEEVARYEAQFSGPKKGLIQFVMDEQAPTPPTSIPTRPSRGGL